MGISAGILLTAGPQNRGRLQGRSAQAFCLFLFLALPLGACDAPPATSGAGAAAAATSSAADRAVLTAARGKRLSIRIVDRCDDGCGLGAPALKTKLDASLARGGLFSAITEERPDFRLVVTLKSLEDESPFDFIDAYAAKADYQFSDVAGKILFAGSATGNSNNSSTEALDRMTTQIAAKLSP